MKSNPWPVRLAVGGVVAAGLGLLLTRSAHAGGGNEDDPVPDPPPNPDPGPSPGPLPPPPGPDIPADAIRPDSVGACVAGMMCGKGLLVRSLRHGQQSFDAEGRHFEGLDALVYRLRWLGVQWLAVEAIFQESTVDRINGHSELWTAYIARMRTEGIQVYAWGWPDPRPNRLPEFERIAAAVANDVAGFWVNAERPWMGRATEANRLMDTMLRLYPGRVGAILYGSRTPRQDHPTFPWDAFAGRSFGLMPMLYETNRPDSYSRDLVDRWADEFGKPIIPLFSATNQRNAAGMEAIIRRSPVPAGACGWWDLYWVTDGGASSRTEIVRRVNLIPGAGNVA